jgi:stage II sporulation protein D
MPSRGEDHDSPRAGRRRAPLAACAVVLALGLAGWGAGGAEAKVIWKVKGGGFGHAVGLSQYGAYGLATHNKGWRQIVGHYYLHTTISPTASRTVRILLLPYQSSVRFRGATSACGVTLSEGKTYSGARSGNSVVLLSPKGATLKNCGGLLSATGGTSVKMLGKGTYRGALQIRPSSVPGTVNAINALGVDPYVQGVVALESPSSWPMNALRAQAVVARSYGLASSVGGKGFELYDNTSSQVYGGIGAETARTNQAVSDTRLQVVKYKGEIAQTFFFSTSGGFTESNEYVFGGKPIAYLRGVVDPYDDASPYHRWVEKLSFGAMQAALSEHVRGKLRKIVVLKRGDSPRIFRARLVGSGGSTKISGQELKSDLGLLDAPWKIKRIVR